MSISLSALCIPLFVSFRLLSHALDILCDMFAILFLPCQGFTPFPSTQDSSESVHRSIAEQPRGAVTLMSFGMPLLLANR